MKDQEFSGPVEQTVAPRETWAPEESPRVSVEQVHQTRAASGVTGANVLSNLSGPIQARFANPGEGGDPNSGVGSRTGRLPTPVQAKMERAFGADFSDVQMHEGPEAPAIGAVAFARGNNVHFAPGQFNPDTRSGQELIGHELAHVVQQRQGRVAPTVQTKGGVTLSEDPGLEAEADRAGEAAAAGQRVQMGAAPTRAGQQGVVQRKNEGDKKDEKKTDVAIGSKTAFEFALAIPLYGPVKLEGKVTGSYEVKSGTTSGATTEVEASLYAGILVDLYILKLRAGMEGKVKFTVKDGTDPLTAIKKGIHEIAQWKVAKDFAPNLRSAKTRLKYHWPQMLEGFNRWHGRILTEIRKGNYKTAADEWTFKKSPREWAEYYVNGWNNSIQTSFDGLGVEVDKSRLVNVGVLEKKFDSIKSAPNKEAAEKIAMEAHQYAINEIVRTLTEAQAAVDKTQAVPNDPKVGFEASLAFKAGASVQAGPEATGEVSVAAVKTIEDKAGQSKWDTEAKDSIVVAGKIAVGKFEAALEGTWKKDEVEIKGNFAGKSSTADPDVASHSVSSIAKAVKGGSSVMQLAGDPKGTTMKIIREVGGMVSAKSKEMTDPAKIAERRKGSMAGEQGFDVEVKLVFDREKGTLKGGGVKLTLITAKLSAEKHLGKAATVGVSGSVSTGTTFEVTW